MEAVIIFALLLSQMTCVWLYWSARESRKDSEWKLLLLAESAMAHIRSKSLAEKAQVDEAKRTYDAQVEYYRDTVAKDALIKANKAKAKLPATMQVPQRLTAIADDGSAKEIDLSDFDILS